VALTVNRAEANRLIKARLATLARGMEKREARLVRDTRSVLEQLRRDLAGEAAKSELDMGGTAWQQARLRALIEASERRIAEAYGEISTGMSGALKGMANTTADGVVLAINGAMGDDFIPPLGWTDATLARIADGTLINGAISSEWWDRQRVGVTRAFADQMRMGMMKGETIAQLRDRVLAKVDLRKEPDYTQRDIIRCARRDAEALVRTSALTVCRQAHLDVYEANADVIAAVEWLSTLDDRTTPLCRALDGLEWTIPGYAPKGHDKPFPGPCPHWNCRSIAVPVTKTWEELAREDGGDSEFAKRLDGGWPNSQRASVDGSVEGGITYKEWATKMAGDGQPPSPPPTQLPEQLPEIETRSEEGLAIDIETKWAIAKAKFEASDERIKEVKKERGKEKRKAEKEFDEAKKKYKDAMATVHRVGDEIENTKKEVAKAEAEVRATEFLCRAGKATEADLEKAKVALEDAETGLAAKRQEHETARAATTPAGNDMEQKKFARALARQRAQDAEADVAVECVSDVIELQWKDTLDTCGVDFPNPLRYGHIAEPMHKETAYAMYHRRTRTVTVSNEYVRKLLKDELPPGYDWDGGGYFVNRETLERVVGEPPWERMQRILTHELTHDSQLHHRADFHELMYNYLRKQSLDYPEWLYVWDPAKDRNFPYSPWKDRPNMITLAKLQKMKGAKK
jgi:hypothetical protein